MNCYYAHSISLFHTKQEERDIITLNKLGFTVFNPSDKQHQQSYYKGGMDYFMRLIEDEIDIVAFRSNPDGSINAGTAQEVQKGIEMGLPVIELPCSINKRTNTIEQTRERLRNEGAR